jgi:hypothetical protein
MTVIDPTPNDDSGAVDTLEPVVPPVVSISDVIKPVCKECFRPIFQDGDWLHWNPEIDIISSPEGATSLRPWQHVAELYVPAPINWGHLDRLGVDMKGKK